MVLLVSVSTYEIWALDQNRRHWVGFGWWKWDGTLGNRMEMERNGATKMMNITDMTRSKTSEFPVFLCVSWTKALSL